MELHNWFRELHELILKVSNSIMELHEYRVMSELALNLDV